MKYFTNLLEKFKKLINNNKVLTVYKFINGVYIIPVVLETCDNTNKYKTISDEIIKYLKETDYKIKNNYLYDQFCNGINAIKIARFNKNIHVYPVAIPYNMNYIMYHKINISIINYTKYNDKDVILRLLYANGYDYDDIDIKEITENDKVLINNIITNKWK